MIRTRLRAERFDEDDCDEWAYRDWRKVLAHPRDMFDESRDQSMCDRVVEAALAYRDTGMPIDEAFAWTIRSISANLAVYNGSAAGTRTPTPRSSRSACPNRCARQSVRDHTSPPGSTHPSPPGASSGTSKRGSPSPKPSH